MLFVVCCLKPSRGFAPKNILGFKSFGSLFTRIYFISEDWGRPHQFRLIVGSLCFVSERCKHEGQEQSSQTGLATGEKNSGYPLSAKYVTRIDLLRTSKPPLLLFFYFVFLFYNLFCKTPHYFSFLPRRQGLRGISLPPNFSARRKHLLRRRCLRHGGDDPKSSGRASSLRWLVQSFGRLESPGIRPFRCSVSRLVSALSLRGSKSMMHNIVGAAASRVVSAIGESHRRQ